MLRRLQRIHQFLGTEAYVLMIIVAGLGAGEIGMRLAEERLSKDVSHLHDFESLASALDEDEDSVYPSVLFLGNSMTRYGVMEDAFSKEYTLQTGARPQTVKINPDNTAIADWYYAYRNFFYERARHPDYLVLGFQGGHLRDQASHHPGRLAHYYCCEANDWRPLTEFDIHNIEDLASFALASISTMYSNRDRVQTRVMDLAIPEYRNSSQDLNKRQNALAGHAHPAPTYARFRELVQMLREQQVQLILAAMPIADPYEIDAELLKIVQEEGIQLVDCRNIPGIVPESFPDGVHMTAEAGDVYSRFLADALAEPQHSIARH